jgi:hypothetical protein
MIQLSPPPPPAAPRVTFDDSRQRMRFRHWQVMATAITIVFTCWFMSFGVLPAILALMVAKHVLVAILAVGLNLPPAAPSAPTFPNSANQASRNIDA